MTIHAKARHTWRPIDPALGRALTDARLQLHHAAQFVAGLGISYLPRQADDSHTNMEWFAGTLASQPVGPRPFRLAVRPNPLSIVVLVGNAELTSFPLHGRTIDGGARWIRSQATKLGLEGDAYTLARHYTIPDHPVAAGRPFDTTDATKFEQLEHWYADAAMALDAFVAATPGAAPVRCWPHHFDIATLITVAPGKTISLGMEPGDIDYDEPYWYASMSPAPSLNAERPPLRGGGSWHTEGWIGAVLPAASMRAADDQRALAEEFIVSAAGACSALLLRAAGPTSTS